MLPAHFRSIVATLFIAALFPLSSSLAASPSPAPPAFTIPAKERIVLYVADG